MSEQRAEYDQVTFIGGELDGRAFPISKKSMLLRRTDAKSIEDFDAGKFNVIEIYDRISETEFRIRA